MSRLFSQRHFSTDSFPAIYFGSMRGIGSNSRMLHHCKTTSAAPSNCISQFLNITAPPPPPETGTFLFSKNKVTSDGFPVGESVNKDMGNDIYTNEYDPANYPEFFPGMASFIDENIVAGDKPSEDRLIASFWDDFGNDVFDYWGYFYIYDVDSGKYYFPILSPQNGSDGSLFTQTFQAFGRTFTIQHGYPVQGVFKFDISVNDERPFYFGAYGNMGSDGDHVITDFMYPYTKGAVNLRLYYVKQAEENNNREILYSYFIPKKISENNSQTYHLYQESNDDNNSLMSKEVTNGLLVYFSKTNDVKEWVVNDLGITDSVGL